MLFISNLRGDSVESVQRLVGRSVIELALHVDSALIEAALLSRSSSQEGVWAAVLVS